MISSSITTNTNLKIVLDTNMFLSGILFHGMIQTVFNLILENALTLYVSPSLKTEIIEKLDAFKTSKKIRNEAILFIEQRGIVIEPEIKITICRDPKDNFILELAEEANADYIITRDKDLLELPDQKWKTTKIIKPEDFLPLLRKMRLV